MAHGTPAQPAEIGPFFTRIRHGRPPDPAELAELERRYDAIGGASPLAERTAAQVAGISRILEARRPGRYTVAFGAKHTSPLIEDTAVGLRGHDRVIGLVLTPHASSMGSHEYLDRARLAIGESAEFVAIGAWYGRPALVALLAARVRAALGEAAARGAARPRVIFTAHSLPERIRAAGDTYPDQLVESARLVAEQAGLSGWEVAWQSAPARARDPWLGPDVRDVVRRLASDEGRAAGSATGADGALDAVVVCPIGFVADHLEVLYDLDVEVAGVAAGCGLSYVRTESLNDDPAFLDVLSDVIVEADGPR
jgi:ferrochelatase